MSIGRDEVLHVARLAELAVPENEVERLVQQLNRIVDYVAQLDEVPADHQAAPFLPGPVQLPLRARGTGPGVSARRGTCTGPGRNGAA